MPRTSTLKAYRTKAAVRQAEYRARLKRDRAPAPRALDAALARAVAMSYVTQGGLEATRAGNVSDVTLPVEALLEAALRVLVDEGGYNHARAGKALGRRLKRPMHVRARMTAYAQE